MVELQTIFNEEPDAVSCIMGLRMASSEFRSAFFKVREVLIECKVSAGVNNRRPPFEKKEEKSEEIEGITEYHKDGTRVDIPKVSKKTPKKATTTTAPKKKEKDPLTDKFDEFILDSYNEGRTALTDIDEIIRMFSLYDGIKLNNQIYAKFRKYLCSIYNAPNGGKIHLESKSSDLPNEDKLDDSGMIFYRHPKYNYLWCREDGTFFYLLPDGKTIKENPITQLD